MCLFLVILWYKKCQKSSLLAYLEISATDRMSIITLTSDDRCPCFQGHGFFHGLVSEQTPGHIGSPAVRLTWIGSYANLVKTCTIVEPCDESLIISDIHIRRITKSCQDPEVWVILQSVSPVIFLPFSSLIYAKNRCKPILLVL